VKVRREAYSPSVVLPFFDPRALLSQAGLPICRTAQGSPKPVVRQSLSETRASLENAGF